MRKQLLMMICLLISVSVSAQTAEEYLISAIKKNKSYDDISIIFNATNIQRDEDVDDSITSNGFASIKGNSYIVNFDGQEMICDGTTLWTHLINDEEVMISEATDDSSPIAIIDSFSKNINATFIKSDTPNIKIVEIKENENTTFEKTQLSFDENLNIKKVHIFISDGIELIYEITEFKTNQNLPDSMFIFNEELHPNVEVIDMR